MVRPAGGLSQIVWIPKRSGLLPKRQVGHIRRELKDRLARIAGLAGLIVPGL
jgi:hypothetical protein